MNLSDQVCSLELAKKLKDLGVKQDSLFVYEYFNDTCYAPKFIPFAIAKPLPNGCKQYSAFTVSELLELLPAMIDAKIDEPFNYFWLTINKRQVKNIQYIINYHCDTIAMDRFPLLPNYFLKNNIYDEKLADCCAKMLIHLIENGFIENEINPKD